MKTDKNTDMGILTELAKLHKACQGKSNMVKLEYLFYTDLDLKGEDLANDLKKLNYSSEVDATHRKCDCTRVFGESALIENREEVIKNWYVELREVGNYYDCDLACYSIIENPKLTLDELMNRDQEVNEQKYEERNEVHRQGLSIYMELRRFHAANALTTQLDFFFYAKDKDNAEALALELRKLSYEVAVEQSYHAEKRYSITGHTPAMVDDELTMENWVSQMNQLAYIHDCDFDGWGSPCADDDDGNDDNEGLKGGWFSDDAPDEVIRKTLGLPPRE
jgi:regulator of RNase E activity RraB